MSSDPHDPIQRDIEPIPVPSSEAWTIRRGARADATGARRRSVVLGTAGAVVVLVAALAIGDRLSTWRMERSAAASPAGAVRTIQPSASALAAATGSPVKDPPLASAICPLGQSPLLDIDHGPPPGDVPGTGAADAEAAFRRAFPNVTAFTMSSFGSDRPAASRDITTVAWIVAGRDTFVSLRLGAADAANSWFAHRARLVRCATPDAGASRTPYSTTTAAGVVLNLTTDPFWVRLREQSAQPGAVGDPRVAAGMLGEPLLVRPLRAGDPSGWIVPVVSQGVPVAAISVSQDAGGMGLATAMRGWPHPTLPAITEASARSRVTAIAGPVSDAWLGWADSLARGRPSDLLSPVWLVTTSRGDRYIVFDDGTTLAARDLGL
jgi:hypothetical protein